MNNFDISKIEGAIMSAVKNAVGGEVYSIRPKSKPKTNYFSVVHIASPLVDKCAYGQAKCLISLFSKDISPDIKNSGQLSIMQTRLASIPLCINGSDVSLLMDDSPSVLGDYPDDYGFTARVLQHSIIIHSNNT